MVAGRLRNRVNIMANTPTRDEYGDESDSWAAVESGVWCEIVPLSGQEFFAARQVQSDVTHKITMRHTANAKAENRLEDEDDSARVFEILTVLDRDPRHLGAERGRLVEIMAKEATT